MGNVRQRKGFLRVCVREAGRVEERRGVKVRVTENEKMGKIVRQGD